MMTSCPECSSTEIVSDLLVFSGDAQTNDRPPYVKLLEPEPAKRPFIWMPKSSPPDFALRFAAHAVTRASTRGTTRKFSQPIARAMSVPIIRCRRCCRCEYWDGGEAAWKHAGLEGEIIAHVPVLLHFDKLAR